MKKLLPLIASALLIAGCADDSANPWSTEQERADSQARKAETTGAKEMAQSKAAAEATATEPDALKYSWQKKAAAEKAAKEAEKAAMPLASGRAVVTAMRGDAGLIQIKRTDATNPGDKLVLSKDGKSLQIVVTAVDGEAVIADISPRQIKTPDLKIGEEVSCAAAAETAPDAAHAPAK